jgi:hypothetical protein
MRLRHRIARGLTVLSIAILPALYSGCGEAPPQTATPARKPAQKPAAVATAVVSDEPDPPMPSLRTGAIKPIEHATPIEARAIESYVEGDHEILLFEVTLNGLGLRQGGSLDVEAAVVDVDRAAGEPVPLAFLERRGAPEVAALWVRRPRSQAGKPVLGTIFTPTGFEYSPRAATPGHRVRFQAAQAGPPSKGGALLPAWAKALSDSMRAKSWGTPFHAFAMERSLALGERGAKAPPKRGAAAPRNPRRPRGDELATLMETTTGVTSIQETLQHERALFIAAGRQRPSIPIDKVAAPKLQIHPFREMLAELKAPVPAEPLAAHAPAEFYYIRFSSISHLFRIVDELDAWGTPIANTLDSRAEDRGLSARYEAALGIGRGPLSRALGPEVIGNVAVVGSDPYAKEGTDITVLFAVKGGKGALFEAGMGAALATHGAAHGGITTSKAAHEGVDIKIARSKDGAVSQHRASIQDVEVVSNSMGAIKRVIEASSKKRPRLQDELDFQYMLARDAATRADVLAFLGDRFVGEVVGPRQKILEARRQMALAELSTPGYAALLYGHIWGKSPASAEEVVKAGLLAKEELKHAGGEAIVWKPGEAARSSWGSPAALVPLIDLPTPTAVTEAERAGYERFVRGYQSYWSTFIDPVMVRIAIDAPAEGSGRGGAITADVRVLPLIDESEYREIQRNVGSMRVDAPAISSGARVVLGVGPDAALRREVVSLLGGGLTRRHGLKLDWLGDWAMAGLSDRTPVAVLAANVLDEEIPARPLIREEVKQGERLGDTLFDDAARLPAFAAVGVKSTAGAAITIAGARLLAKEALPGLVEWGEHEKYRDVAIVRVSVAEGAKLGLTERPIHLYYAFCEGALVLSLRNDVIRALIDERLDKKAPTTAAPAQVGGREAPQLVIDIAPGERGPIWTVLTWLLEGEALRAARGSRAAAEAVLRGAPERSGDAAAMRQLAIATLGSAPVTPDGGVYSLGPDGVRDPARGTLHAPSWPAVPVAGSPVAKVMASLLSFRAELSFDDEARPRGSEQMQSLHARVTLGTRE